MENIIIIAILVLLVFNGVRSSLKHFKGEGGCCGGGDEKVKRKKLKNIVAEKVVKIEGMTCEHCKKRVESYIATIDGAAAKVNLNKKIALVSMEKNVTDEQIREVIEKAGYEVVEISYK